MTGDVWSEVITSARMINRALMDLHQPGVVLADQLILLFQMDCS